MYYCILELSDHFTVACLNSLDILNDFVFHIVRLLLRFEELSDKLLELEVFGRNYSICRRAFLFRFGASVRLLGSLVPTAAGVWRF
jgi:hypothetical protein